MTKALILQEIAHDKKYMDYCKRVASSDYMDLFQHIFEEIANKNEAHLIDLWERKKFGMYYAAIVYKSYNSKHSSFFYLHKKENSDKKLIDKKELIFEPKKIPPLSVIEKKLREFADKNENNWYDANVLNLYLIHGTVRKVGEITGIPYRSVSHSLIKMKKLVKKICCEYCS